jgi:solute carrier family 25 oxoglutarate transporter 11
MIAGLIGSGIANPFDMALIRFQSDSSLPKEERRNYKHVFDALSKMKQEEGLLGLWRGAIPTIIRAMAMNSFTLVAYNEVKEILMLKMNEKKETTEIRLMGSAIAGISASVGSLPFDNAKTKILKQKKSNNMLMQTHKASTPTRT